MWQVVLSKYLQHTSARIRFIELLSLNVAYCSAFKLDRNLVSASVVSTSRTAAGATLCDTSCCVSDITRGKGQCNYVMSKLLLKCNEFHSDYSTTCTVNTSLSG